MQTRIVFPIEVEGLAQEIVAAQAEIIHLSVQMNGQHVLLQSRSGEVRGLDYMALIGMFRGGKSFVRLAYLNASFSFELAKALTTFADAAIGVPGNITDIGADAVAARFYRKLASGQTVPTALTGACRAFQDLFPDARLEGLPRVALKSEAPSSSPSLAPRDLEAGSR